MNHNSEIKQENENLYNIMMCARWLVLQLERLEHFSLAKVFQIAINDADAWIQTMTEEKEIYSEHTNSIKAKEATDIHNMLIKYASINDTSLRHETLNKMLVAVNSNGFTKENNEHNDRRP